MWHEGRKCSTWIESLNIHFFVQMWMYTLLIQDTQDRALWILKITWCRQLSKSKRESHIRWTQMLEAALGIKKKQRLQSDGKKIKQTYKACKYIALMQIHYNILFIKIPTNGKLSKSHICKVAFLLWEDTEILTSPKQHAKTYSLNFFFLVFKYVGWIVNCMNNGKKFPALWLLFMLHVSLGSLRR